MKKFVTLAGGISLAALANDAAMVDKIVVEAAYKTPVSLEQTTSSVEVIETKELEEQHITTVAEALSRVVGISFSSTGGPGQVTNLYLRGFDSKRTLVLIDGIRVNDVTGLSGAQFDQLMAFNIERIEIVKGPQSGVWGADAAAGVVNIVTKKAKEGFHATVGGEWGSYATQKYSTTLSYKNDRFDFIAGLFRLNTDGFSAAEPKKGDPNYGKRGDELGWEDDAYENTTYDLKAGINLSKKDRVELFYQRIDATVHYDAGAGMDARDWDDPYGWGASSYVNEIDNRFSKVSFLHKENIHDIEAHYALSDFKRSQYGGYSGDVKEYGAQDTIRYLDNAFAVVGLSRSDFAQEKSAGKDFNKEYTNKALFVTNSNTFAGGKTVLTESFRHDAFDAFDDKTSVKIGVKHNVTEDLAVLANYGTAYNVPTLYQLFEPATPWGPIGNENLEPEKTRGYDLSLEYKSFKISYFDNRIEDLIDYDWSAGYVNIDGTSKIKGIEAKFIHDLSSELVMSIGYTYLDAKKENGQRLANRPRHEVDFGLDYYPTDKIHLGANSAYIGDRFDGATKAQTGGYTLFDAVADYEIDQNFTVYLKAENLTDKYYQTVDGYATAGRSIYAGLSAKF